MSIAFELRAARLAFGDAPGLNGLIRAADNGCQKGAAASWARIRKELQRQHGAKFKPMLEQGRAELKKRIRAAHAERANKATNAMEVAMAAVAASDAEKRFRRF